jgi:gp16 family phage-associated protein
MNTRLRTREEAKAWLEEHGVSVAEFARCIGVSKLVVYSLLGGHIAGKRGEGHKAAVALGMKPKPDGEPPISLQHFEGGSVDKSVDREIGQHFV